MKKTAVLLVNLGTPDAPTPRAVRAFLKAFLSDPRVVDFWRPLWWCVLNGIILNTRPRKVAEAYASLWEAWGDSPLRRITERQVTGLRERLGPSVADVAYAFTYGMPAIADTVRQWDAAGMERIVVLPLYPQYSTTTTLPVLDQLDAVRPTLQRAELCVIRQYADHPAYIEALANSVRRHWEKHGQGDVLLMSYHGIPKRYVQQRSDPYPNACESTSERLAAALDLTASDWQHVYQSRFGPEPWLQPYLSDTVVALGEQGVNTVDVIAPSFSVDCLETLEEIAEEASTDFRAAGGGVLRAIPCLNDETDHLAMMRALVEAT